MLVEAVVPIFSVQLFMVPDPKDVTLNDRAVMLPAWMPAALSSAAVKRYWALLSLPAPLLKGPPVMLDETPVPTVAVPAAPLIEIALRVEVAPEHTTDGVADTFEMFGDGFMVTLTDEVVVHTPSEAVTV